MTVDLKPYDEHVSWQVFSALFCNTQAREDGMTEIPSASLQLVVSGLEYIAWEVSGEELDTIKGAIRIADRLRDEQKLREWKRKIAD